MAKVIWHGQSCFQISVSNSKDHQAEIVIDPFSETGLKLPNLKADILLITHQHQDHNNVKSVSSNPFLIDNPGEYEVKGVFVRGIDSFHDDKEGKERGKNTIYTIEAENMKLCHLGDIGQNQLSDEQLEKIGTVDILMIPVGGVYTISAAEALKIISQIEPKIVIPMHYSLPNLKFKLDSLDKFLKSMGKNSVQEQEKIIVKTSSLPKEGQTEIMVLKP